MLFGKPVKMGRCVGEELAVRPFGALGGLLQQQRTRQEGEGDVLPAGRIRFTGIRLGCKPLPQIGRPGVEVIDPAFQGIEPISEFVHGEACGPKVVGESDERYCAPVGFACVAI